MADGATCLREHYPHEKELQVADSVECVVEINCENDNCGPHTVHYNDEIL